jgi:hypothetical protein
VQHTMAHGCSYPDGVAHPGSALSDPTEPADVEGSPMQLSFHASVPDRRSGGARMPSGARKPSRASSAHKPRGAHRPDGARMSGSARRPDGARMPGSALRTDRTPGSCRSTSDALPTFTPLTGPAGESARATVGGVALQVDADAVAHREPRLARADPTDACHARSACVAADPTVARV